jgi:hypothetical protein
MTLSISAFAKGKSAEVELRQASQIAGTTLQPGTYTVVMTVAGSAADVSFRQNGKQVAVVTGQVVQLAKKSDKTSLTVNNSGTVPTIAEIDLQGSQAAVSFASEASTTSSGE